MKHLLSGAIPESDSLLCFDHGLVGLKASSSKAFGLKAHQTCLTNLKTSSGQYTLCLRPVV